MSEHGAEQIQEGASAPVYDQHCPDCGATGSVRREPFETLVVCPNDDCYRVIISVNSRVAA